MTDSVIERVARAMCVADKRDPDAPRWVSYPGARTSGIYWHENIDKAKAALDVCWQEISSHIVQGNLGGNGCDKTAERNGLILAANLLLPPIDAALSETTT